MYKHILIATDGSELAAKAVTSGIELAKRLGAKLTAVTASEPWTTMMVAATRAPPSQPWNTRERRPRTQTTFWPR